MSKAAQPRVHHPVVHSHCAVTRPLHHPHPYCSPLRNGQGNSSLACQPATQFLLLIFAETCLMALMHDHISLICILQLLGTIFYKPIRSRLLIVSCTSSKALVLFGLNIPSISERGVLKFPTVVHFSLSVLSNSAYF